MDISLDQNINRHYAQEQIVGNQIMLFTFLAIGIACLGLLGTTTNKVVEKTKEIGIRKILGARMHQLAQIILNTTARQVVIANVNWYPGSLLSGERYGKIFRTPKLNGGTMRCLSYCYCSSWLSLFSGVT